MISRHGHRRRTVQPSLLLQIFWPRRTPIQRLPLVNAAQVFRYRAQVYLIVAYPASDGCLFALHARGAILPLLRFDLTPAGHIFVMLGQRYGKSMPTGPVRHKEDIGGIIRVQCRLD